MAHIKRIVQFIIPSKTLQQELEGLDCTHRSLSALPLLQQQQRHLLLSTPRPAQQQRSQLRCNAASSVGAEDAMRLVQREGYKILDVRSARDYDDKHITKPAKSSLNAPVVMNDNSTPNHRFLDEVCTGLGCSVHMCTGIAAWNLQLVVVVG
jgi:hypothetical protein